MFLVQNHNYLEICLIILISFFIKHFFLLKSSCLENDLFFNLLLVITQNRRLLGTGAFALELVRPRSSENDLVTTVHPTATVDRLCERPAPEALKLERTSTSYVRGSARVVAVIEVVGWV